MLRGQLQTIQFDSQCLRGNPLGDPTHRETWVYTPPGYESGGRFPTVTLLPGFAGNHRSMLGFSPWKPNTVELFEGLLDKESCPPAILVMPDCTTRWGGSQFIDSPATGMYQTYLAEEVIPEIDRRFRTIASREGRAFAGRSSGGFGALRLGMDRPDLVSVLGSHAGDAAFDISMRPMLTSASIGLAKAGGLSNFLENVSERGPRGSAEFDAIFVAACAAAYSGSEDLPFPHFSLPMDITTARIIPEVWSDWLANDPLLLAPTAAKALSTMSLIFIDAGDVDEHGLQFAASQLAETLKSQGAAVLHEEYPGGHRHTSYRYENSLPKMIEALAPAER